MTADPITIRGAGPADAPALTRLAALDSTRELRGTILVCESDGALRAAWSMEEHRAIADPFRPTADDVALLRMHADHVAGRNGRRRGRPRLRLRSPVRPASAT
jgi:hypothetical protein